MKKKTLITIWEYITLTVACFIFAMSWECFMIPNGMSAGGMMGLCTVIQYATGGFIQAQYSYIVINAALIIIAVFAMGIGFGFKTIYCIAMSSLAMQLMASLPVLHSVAGQFFYVRETLLIPIFAGVLESVGLGLTLRYGGSTGGTDIIALMVNKYWPVSLSTVFFISDFVIVALLLFLPDKNFAVVVGGKKSSYQLMVFSEKFSEIADYIAVKMERGVTLLQAKGWYTKKDREVLLILISQKEFPALSKVIKDIDPKAFMSVSPTHSVFGEGFEEIKAGIHTKKKKDGAE